jgi:tetratricopeptide (TPR) repeat protein
MITKKIQWFIFALACLIYANTIPNKWAIDDGIIIHQNNFVKRGVSGIGSTLTTDAFAGFYGKDINAVAGGRWRPLSPTLFGIEAEIFASTKKDVNQNVEKDEDGFSVKDLSEKTWFPNILHFFNMFWYGLLCLVLFRTLLLLLNPTREETNFKAQFIATVTALLYTVHPLHTEAVANVKGLDEILALLGALASLYSVLKIVTLSDKQDKKKWSIASVAFFFLALLAKESAITFVAVIPLALWFFTEISVKSILKLTAPLVLTLFVFLGIRGAVLYQPNKEQAIAEELMNDPFLVLDVNAKYQPLVPGSITQKLVSPNADTFVKMPFMNQLATNLYTYSNYLKLLVVPYPLTVDYYPRHIEIKSFSQISVLFSVIIHLFLLIWALLNTKRKNLIAFGILYYFITFSITSNLLFPIGTNMAERFMFMPSVGFCLVVACIFYALGNKLSQPKTNSGFSKIYVGLGIIVAVFAALTIMRNFDWKDNFTLFSKDILVSKNSGKLNNDLAGTYILKVVTTKQDKLKEIEDLSIEEKKAAVKAIEVDNTELLNKSITLIQTALQVHPMSNAAWLNMGKAYHFLGQSESNPPNVNLTYLYTALAAYEQADYYKGVGMDKTIHEFQTLCFLDFGKLMGQKFGDINTAITYFEKAKVLTPDQAETYMLLGTAYSMINNYEKSVENTEKSLSLRPNDRDTKENLAVAYQQYALANASRKDLLPKAEKILLEVFNEEKKLNDNDINKQPSKSRTLDLLYKNAVLQGNMTKQNTYKSELLKLNPKQ